MMWASRQHRIPALACALLLLPNLAFADDAALCPFIKKVVAAVPTEFAGLRGPLNKTIMGSLPNNSIFVGTLSPSPGLECTQVIRRYGSAEKTSILPPTYDCYLEDVTSYDQAEARQAQISAVVQACLPDWKFTKSAGGAREKRSAYQALEGVGPNAKLSLDYTDHDFLDPSLPPRIRILLKFESTLPAAKGAVIPVME